MCFYAHGWISELTYQAHAGSLCLDDYKELQNDCEDVQIDYKEVHTTTERYKKNTDTQHDKDMQQHHK